MNKKIIMFDFDGTIANTLYLGFQITNDLSHEFGIEKLTVQQLSNIRDITAQEVMKMFGISIVKLPFIAIKFQRELHNRINELQPIEGIFEIIKKIKNEFTNIILGIVTSNSYKNVSVFLKNNNAENLFDFIKSERNVFGKSSTLNKILKKYHIEPSKAIYVGDETRDIEAAHKSMIESIAVTWGFNSQEALLKMTPNHLIHKPEELFEIIKETNK